MNSKPTIVVLGAGNIGRGLIGQLGAEAGYHLVFVEAFADFARRLRQAGRYGVHIVGREPSDHWVEDYEILTPEQSEAIGRAVEGCEFLVTAVGGPNLKAAVALIAPHLAARTRGPLNILICENLPHADHVLGEALAAQGIGPERFAAVPSSVERMVQSRPESLDLLGESGQTLYIDKDAWRGEKPAIEGFQFRGKIDFYYHRKIVMNNAGHALLAYEGWLHGCRMLCEALAFEDIRRDLKDLLDAAARMLSRKYDVPIEELEAHNEELTRDRFGNVALSDTVKRVARQPLRKLGPDERLVGLARDLAAYGLPTEPVARVIGAAMHYHEPEDDDCPRLQGMIAQGGAESVLREVCGLKDGQRLLEESLRAYEEWMSLVSQAGRA